MTNSKSLGRISFRERSDSARIIGDLSTGVASHRRFSDFAADFNIFEIADFTILRFRPRFRPYSFVGSSSPSLLFSSKLLILVGTMDEVASMSTSTSEEERIEDASGGRMPLGNESSRDIGDSLVAG